MRGHIFLFLLLAMSACGGSSDSSSGADITTLNQDCIDGKISGEFVVETTDGKQHIITAASTRHLRSKIKIEKLKVKRFEQNFRITSPQTLKPLAAMSAEDINIGPRFVGADFLWSQGFKGSGVVTALIDSGYDFSHNLLKGTVFENTADEGEDEDGNGFIGDRLGWDTFNNRPITGDLGRHGTQMGSVIAARHSSTFKFSVAPESKIVPIAALQAQEDGDTSASGDSNSITAAIDYAISRDVDFINASWGGDICSTFIRERIRLATNKGIVFITSAGNSSADLDRTIAFPASLPFANLLTVGSVNSDGSREQNSNFGQIVDFTALGSDVVVASPQSQLGAVTGTSVATPFITGGLALLKNAFPEASSEALIQAMEESKNDGKTPDLRAAFAILKQR